MTRLPVMAVAAACCLALSACNGGGSPEGTTTRSSSTSSSTTTTSDYKDDATEAARAWIEDDAARLTTDNATPEMVAKQKRVDAANKKAGVTSKGHDTVISSEVNEGLTNTTEVIIDVCVTTDKQLLHKGKNVRTDREGKPVKPGDRQLATVEMKREVGGETWLVADSEVRKLSC